MAKGEAPLQSQADSVEQAGAVVLLLASTARHTRDQLALL